MRPRHPLKCFIYLRKLLLDLVLFGGFLKPFELLFQRKFWFFPALSFAKSDTRMIADAA